jgi:copper resistance protein C
MKRLFVVVPTIRSLGLVVIACLLLPASGAFAHAEPERANPPINGRVATAPAILEVWFTEEVATDNITLAVKAPDGTAADLDDAAVDLFDPERAHVTVSLRPGLPAGNYVVQWHTVSATDGDAADGFFSFVVETGSPGASPVASPIASAGGASPVTSPVAAVASPVAQATAVATSAPAATTTPFPPSLATGDDDFDSRAFGIAVVVGIGVAIALYLFWRLVRPKPGERQPPS